MKKILIFFILSIFLISIILADAQKTAFESIDHKYIYDIQESGLVKCTWSTTIIPKETTILYNISFRGGKTKDYSAIDSLGKAIDVDVNEGEGQRIVYLMLDNLNLNQPYQFNLSFLWEGLMTRTEERHTLYTSVNVGEPQSAKIVVITPMGSKLGTSVVTRGKLSEPFRRAVVFDRPALVWNVTNTGNETTITFRANFNYYNAMMRFTDSLPMILIGAFILLVGALLLGYRKRLPGLAAWIKNLLRDGMR
jgi:hypothetical protein